MTKYVRNDDGKSVLQDVPLGSIWCHLNGNQYEVYDHTNIYEGNPKYQPTVSYKDSKNGHKYSRLWSDWHRSMVRVKNV